jgi:hypothetical protein
LYNFVFWGASIVSIFILFLQWANQIRSLQKKEKKNWTCEAPQLINRINIYLGAGHIKWSY